MVTLCLRRARTVACQPQRSRSCCVDSDACTLSSPVLEGEAAAEEEEEEVVVVETE
jgi:hypothetical protein